MDIPRSHKTWIVAGEPCCFPKPHIRICGVFWLAAVLLFATPLPAEDTRAVSDAPGRLPEVPMLKLARLFAMPEPDAGEVAVVMEKWAGADLPAALEWAATVAPGVVRDEVMASVVRVWSRTDPVAAADLLRTQIADSNVLHQCIQHLAATWGAVDLRAVRAWAKSLPDSQAAAARRGATEASSASKYTRPSRP